MTATDFLRDFLNPGLAWCETLPGWSIPADERARLLLLAIAGQESNWENVHQAGGGVAVDPFQFEPEACTEILLNRATSTLARLVCRMLYLPPNGPAVYHRLLGEPHLAVAFARLNLWTDPYPLPSVGDESHAWHMYLAVWRPGRPHPVTWPIVYAASMAAIGAGANGGQPNV